MTGGVTDADSKIGVARLHADGVAVGVDDGYASAVDIVVERRKGGVSRQTVGLIERIRRERRKQGVLGGANIDVGVFQVVDLLPAVQAAWRKLP